MNPMILKIGEIRMNLLTVSAWHEHDEKRTTVYTVDGKVHTLPMSIEEFDERMVRVSYLNRTSS